MDLDSVYRAEYRRCVATLTRLLGDIGLNLKAQQRRPRRDIPPTLKRQRSTCGQTPQYSTETTSRTTPGTIRWISPETSGQATRPVLPPAMPSRLP